MYILVSKNNYVSQLLFNKIKKEFQGEWLFISNREYINEIENKNIEKITVV